MKKIISMAGLVGLLLLITGLLTAAAPLPVTTFELVNGSPPPTFTMNVGETVTVIVHVESNVPFLFAQALPTAQRAFLKSICSQFEHTANAGDIDDGLTGRNCMLKITR